VSIVFVLGIYFLIRGKRIPFPLKLTWGGAGLMAVLSLSYMLVDNDPSPIHAVALFLILMRTLSLGGLLTAQYYNFFRINPLTYYSHVTGVNWFVHYPYANPVGIEVGTYTSGNPTFDATAHFWAADGLQALGLPGVLLISVFCSVVFWVFDSAAQRHDPRLAALVTCYAIYNMANISIFTSLLSGGFALLMIILSLIPPRAIGSRSASQYRARSPMLGTVPRPALTHPDPC